MRFGLTEEEYGEVGDAAAGAASEEEFFARLRDAGVLVRTRFSTRDPGQVTS